MRRVLFILSVLILTIIACQTFFPSPTPTLPSSTSTVTPRPTALPSATASPTGTETILPSYTPANTQLPASTQIRSNEFEVQYHPDDALYVGDLVSLEIIAPQDVMLPDTQITIQSGSPDEIILGTTNFSQWGIEGREQATLIWTWDTSSHSAGKHELSFSIQPQNITWKQTITLLPSEEQAQYYTQAIWSYVQTSCCEIHYITQTAAERDIQNLSAMIEEQAQDAAVKMATTFSEPVGIIILPRLLGHGGFAADQVHVSYLDRNYAPNDWDRVVHHEMIHILDRRAGGDLLPTMFVEGLAVYLSGGHYKPEPLMERCTALLNDNLDWLLPLTTLADNFYASQHEIGYLQAGALIEFMVQKYGWEAFSAFYRDIHPVPDGKQSDAIEDALGRHFTVTLSQLEQDFIVALQSISSSTYWEDDVFITVSLFDTIRRYQQILDPSAYFRTAWLLDTKQMIERGITADYLRHPSSVENLTLETMMVAAGEDLDYPPYPQAILLIDAINSVLDEIESYNNQPFLTEPLAQEYYSIVQILMSAGYEPQKINITGMQAIAQVGRSHDGLEKLTLQKIDGHWIIQ